VIKVGPSGEKFYVYQLGETMEQAQREIFTLVLELNGGNRTHTARALGIYIRTCRNWIRRWDLRSVESHWLEQKLDRLARAKDPQGVPD
jgi:DNA-binding NtrC family response regulator